MIFERTLVAGCLQDPKVLRTVRRSTLLPNHISDKIGRYLLELALDIGREGKVTEEIVLECIKQDSSLDSKVKPVYLKTAVDLFKEDISNASFTLGKIQKKVKEKEAIRIAGNVASDIQAGENIEQVLERMSVHLNKIKDTEIAYELFDYVKTYDERKVERLESVGEGSKALKFIDNIRPFQPYFPRGLQPETITAIGGRTGAGKSMFLANMIRVAVLPENKLNVLYIVAENSKIETGSRLDAIMLDREYETLFMPVARDPRGDSFFANFEQQGGGGLWIAKVDVGRFSTLHIKAMIEECREAGFNPDVLAVDSPDHMVPEVDKRLSSWEAKGAVYLDLKDLATAEDLIVLTTLPMKASSKRQDKVSAEDAAGSYDISRLSNNMIFFTETPDDKMLSRATMIVTKNRDGTIDDRHIYFRFSPSRRMIPWDEVERAAMKDGAFGYKIQGPDDVAPVGADLDLGSESSLNATGTGLDNPKFKRGFA